MLCNCKSTAQHFVFHQTYSITQCYLHGGLGSKTCNTVQVHFNDSIDYLELICPILIRFRIEDQFHFSMYASRKDCVLVVGKYSQKSSFAINNTTYMVKIQLRLFV